MGLALHGDSVFVPTSDLHVMALDAKTGELVWDHTIASASQLTGAHPVPVAQRAAGGRRQGHPGRHRQLLAGGGFIVALDLNSGNEVWRFHTIARPGEPGGNSWNGLPLDKRSGGSVWHQGTYDPELNLIYFGVAPTYDTGPLLHPVTTRASPATRCTPTARSR